MPYYRSSKYNNKKVMIDGYVFDSKLEAEYYRELKLRQSAGDIRKFIIKPRYTLIPKNEYYRKVDYVADFLIIHNSGEQEVIDCKGFETAEFIIKKKLFYDKFRKVINLVRKRKK